MKLIKAILVAATLALPATTLAAEPPRRLSHYTHQRWTEGSEAPARVLSIAQGRDGFLWLATDEGLFRFDGIGFEAIPAEGAGQPHDPPSTVLAARNGDIWTNLQASRRFAVYRGGRLQVLDSPPAPDRIMAMAEGADGAIWALTNKFDGEVLRLQNGRWRLYGPAQGLPRDDAMNMLVAADGALWVAFSGAIMRLAAGAERFETVTMTGGNGRISQDPAGRIWLSDFRGTYPISGPGGQGPAPAAPAPYRTDDSQIRGAPMFDRAGNLWIARRYGGVQRVTAAASTDGPHRVESFRSSDGLSSDVTNVVFEDREGNIWIGSERGLDKFRAATLRAEPELTAPAAFGDKLMSASDGAVYIGQSKVIYRVAPGGEPKAILRDVHEPQAICEAPDGAVWIAFARYAAVWRDGRVQRRVDLPLDRGNHGIIYDCAFDAAGDFWISASGGGLRRYRQGRWERMYGSSGADFNPTTMVRDAHGRLVVQWAARTLARIEGAALGFTPLDFGAGEPEVVSLYPSAAGGVLAAGVFGLSRIRDGKVETLRTGRGPTNKRINGIVQTPDGDVWLAFPREIVRLRPEEFERALTTRALPQPGLSLGFGDGLTSRAHSHSQRSLVRGGDGRLWVATETGTLWMDPRQIVANRRAPGVTITSLTSDGVRYRDPVLLKLRAGASNIEIDYAVLSFADARRAAVRYRLEGFDHAWLDPGSRRQAFYTNLRPGKYRFRVIAANAEGVWNDAGAVLDFEIPPTFLQSRWFLALCVGMGLALLAALYRFRGAQVGDRVRAELEARLEERERIARELHDTLLQSVQGLILRFQSVANKMATGDPSRALLESALERADQVIVDGRNRVRDLRTDESRDDLRAVLQNAVEATAFESAVAPRIVIEGVPRAVHPLVSAEIGRIVGEALFNVARHAQARIVDVVVFFGDQQLSVRVRDDGVGISPDIVAKGRKPGHFGLVGMRERAERIGGTLAVESPAGSGTVVKLTLPAKLAYSDRAPRRRLSDLFRLRKGVARV